MEQITRKEDTIYYGKIRCKDADEAYEHFREEYHDELGKRVYRRLNRVGQREERIHEFGFCFDGRHDGGRDCGTVKKVDTRLLGLVCGSYCRVVGGWDYPDLYGDDEFDRWFDKAFSAESKALRLVGRNAKAGRTSKIANKRYR